MARNGKMWHLAHREHGHEHNHGKEHEHNHGKEQEHEHNHGKEHEHEHEHHHVVDKHHGMPHGSVKTPYMIWQGAKLRSKSKSKCKKSLVNGHMLLRNKKGRFCKKSKSRSRK